MWKHAYAFSTPSLPLIHCFVLLEAYTKLNVNFKTQKCVDAPVQPHKQLHTRTHTHVKLWVGKEIPSAYLLASAMSVCLTLRPSVQQRLVQARDFPFCSPTLPDLSFINMSFGEISKYRIILTTEEPIKISCALSVILLKEFLYITYCIYSICSIYQKL